MNIHRIYYPIMALGPGCRVGIWTRGCQRRCRGCMSPDLWEKDPGREMPIEPLLERLAHMLQYSLADGVTISGGEPLEQYDELLQMLECISRYNNDILLYTGFTREELGDREAELLRYTNLVLGPYIPELNDDLPLRGSSNQEIVFRNDELAKRYEKTLAGKRELQAVVGAREIFLAGLLGPEAAAGSCGA